MAPTNPFLSQFTPLSFPNLGLVRFPSLTISPEERVALGVKPTATDRDVLRTLAWKGFLELEAKGAFAGINRETVIAQFKAEFVTFDKTGVIPYLLLVHDINRWADKQGIIRGYGRGSAASSLTNYCLGITRVNPIRHGLNFQRFISEARMKPVVKDGVVYVDGKAAPDIDCDYEYLRRADVVKYVETKYVGRTSKISTRLELTGKTALKDVLKVYAGYDEEEAKAVGGMIEARFGKVQSLHEAREKNEDVKKWLTLDPRNAEIFALAMAIEGAPVAKGQHPSGVLVAYDPLDGNIPTELSKTGDVVSSFDMETVAGLAIKIDLLGLRSADIVAQTAALAGERVEDIDVNSPVIYDYLNRCSTYMGLFQIEEGTTKEAVLQIKPRNIDDLSAAVAISRPGALAGLKQFADYTNKGLLKTIYPPVDEVLKPTGNVLVFQEQITAVCISVFGMSPIDADSVRYAVSKKKREEMAKWEAVLYENGRARGVPDVVIKYFWDVCNASADYLFVKCLHPATLVTTPDGPRRLDAIQPGDSVLAPSGFVRVVAVHTGYRPLYTAFLSNGRQITCSLDHKLKCVDGAMRTLRELLRHPTCPLLTEDNTSPIIEHWTGSNQPELTLDLEVDHFDHLFFANGIVVSNSHAFSYAYLSAATIYLKAKHPQAFYLTMLRLAREEPNPTEYMNSIIAEMKQTGVKLLPPSIIKSQSDFSLERDEATGETSIRFGLASVKGISDSTMAKLAGFNRSFTTKFDMFEAAKAAGINIAVLTSLIYSGCLEWPGVPRTKLALEAQLYNLLSKSDRQKRLVTQFAPEHDWDLTATIKGLADRKDEKGKVLLPASQLDTLRRNYQPYWDQYVANAKNEELCAYVMERHLLGFSYSGSLHQIFSTRVVGLLSVVQVLDKGRIAAEERAKVVAEHALKGTTPPKPARQDPVKLVCFVDEAKSCVSQKSKEPYIKLVLSDDTGSIKAMLHGSERVEACRSFNGGLPKEGDLVIVTATFARDGGILFADSLIIQPISVKLKRSDPGTVVI